MDNLIEESKQGNLQALTSTQELRDRAKQFVEEGAVTQGYAANKEEVINLLNAALATELVCVLRYRRHYHMAKGIHSDSVKAEFLEHAIEEMEHADRIAKRITELGGEPDFSPKGLSERSHAQYAPGDTLESMIKENLIAERIAIESYREFVAYLGGDDPTTQRMLKDILSVEEEHADEMASLLKGF